MESSKGRRRTLEGTVVSAKMQKSVMVKVDRTFAHPYYQKILRRTRKYMAHDEMGQCTVGDRVSILEVRPLSKNKRWLVTKVIAKAE
ncbi:30S ribosomal protein S17 [bacterium]|nr:30S ribosomal protein S17 [bacterium]